MGKRILQESWNRNWHTSQRGDAKVLSKGLLPSQASPQEEVSHCHSQNHLQFSLLTKVRGKLLSVSEECENSRTDGWGRKLREGQRENKQGFLWWVTAFLETTSEATTKSPACACPRLALCTEENVANKVPSHIWEPTGHAQGRGLRRSQAEPGTCDNLHIACLCLQGTPVGGLKILRSSSPFL